MGIIVVVTAMVDKENRGQSLEQRSGREQRLEIRQREERR
jgi:hypothetical protein